MTGLVTTNAREERILVVAPTGSDREVIADVLGRSGLEVQGCDDIEQLIRAFEEGAGALLIAEEALTTPVIARLSDVLRRQPPWSDIPIVLSTCSGDTTTAQVRTVRALDACVNVTILERPMRVLTMTITLQAALRARRRQYAMRELLMERERQVETLQAEREARARFVSLLAHDLRGPLSNAMLLSARVIDHPETEERRRDLVLRTVRNLNRIERMLRDLLDASRIQAGQKLPLRCVECDLAAIATEAIEDLHGATKEQVVLDAPKSVVGTWSAEELRRAIWNLATNAIKYGAPDKPVVVRVEAHDGRARVSVHNHGSTLSPEQQKGVFEPFARTATAASKSGWGLGLTLVRGCAEAHGGTVRVASSQDDGTAFTIDLPLDAQAFQTGINDQEIEVSPPSKRMTG